MSTAALGRESQKKQLENQIASDLEEIALNRMAILRAQERTNRLREETKQVFEEIDKILISPLERLKRA